MRQLPVLEVSSTDEGSLEDEELVITHNCKNQLKSDKLRICDSLVVPHVVWPHKLVYTAEGQPAIYDTISVPLFISGYMQAMEAKKPVIRPLIAAHLVELIGDATHLSCCLATTAGA